MHNGIAVGLMMLALCSGALAGIYLAENSHAGELTCSVGDDNFTYCMRDGRAVCRTVITGNETTPSRCVWDVGWPNDNA